MPGKHPRLDCPFCQIVHDAAPAQIVREWADTLAIVPRSGGCTEGHLLVLHRARSAERALPFHNLGDDTEVDAEAALDVIALLSLTSSRPGGAVVRTRYADDTSRVLGWRLRHCTAHPLNRAEIFDAYCTDAVTGEPIPPEPGTEYADAPPVGA
ncbi:hypothetical protein [Streptomyces sp. CC228A]|uniref:hypothetical protein n=1 Tax=Streptomyces sp. CC228A TaxID=2898186 RepID=UPI001F2076A0|nr:hypothetical protein [Streptomyces sp. CC228A]